MRIDEQRRPPVGLPMAYYLKHAAVTLSACDSNLIRVSFSTSTDTAAKLGVDNVVQGYQSVLRANGRRSSRARSDRSTPSWRGSTPSSPP